MVLHFKDHELDSLVRQLAYRHGIGLTDTVRYAVKRALELPEDPQSRQAGKAIDHLMLAIELLGGPSKTSLAQTPVHWTRYRYPPGLHGGPPGEVRGADELSARD